MTGKVHEFKVIDFKTKRQKNEQKKQYLYIKSMCQRGRPNLFDTLIAKVEEKLTQEKVDSCNLLMEKLKKGGFDPLVIFQEATTMYDDDNRNDNEIDWTLIIDEALTYYAINRKYSREQSEAALKLHPFISFK